jgi:hypothetical protein
MDTRLNRKLQILIFIVYAANACIFPFQAVYFSDRHLSFTQIGIAEESYLAEQLPPSCMVCWRLPALPLSVLL